MWNLLVAYKASDAALGVVPTSQSKIADYSRQLSGVVETGRKPDDAVAGLLQAD